MYEDISISSWHYTDQQARTERSVLKYERVEIPGTVFRINARFDNDESSHFIVKKLVMNEGVQSLMLFAHRRFSVNVPKSYSFENST